MIALPALVGAAVPAHAESGPYVALAYSPALAYPPADGAAGTGAGEPVDVVFLNSGDAFSLVELCRDNWCHLAISFAPGGTRWVYQDGFLSVG